MDLDKWQQREARQYAQDNGVSYEDAVAALHPDVPTTSDAGPESGGEDEQPAPARVSTRKSSR